MRRDSWSDEELLRMLDLLENQKMPVSKAAKKLGRSVGAVSGMRALINKTTDRSEQESQQ